MGLDFSSGYRDDGGEEGNEKKEGKEIDYIRRMREPAEGNQEMDGKRNEGSSFLVFFFHFIPYYIQSISFFFPPSMGGSRFFFFLGFFVLYISLSYRPCGAHQLADKRPNARQPTNKPTSKNAKCVAYTVLYITRPGSRTDDFCSPFFRLLQYIRFHHQLAFLADCIRSSKQHTTLSQVFKNKKEKKRPILSKTI